MAPPAADMYPATPELDIEVSWAAKLLPELDLQANWTSLLEGQLGTAADPADDQLPRIDVFLCPSDVQTNATAAALTYVANSGIPDASAAGNAVSDSKANGVCHNLLPSVNGPSVRSGDLKDGANYTLLYSENLHRDQPGSGVSGNTWLRPVTGAANTEQAYGMVWVYDDASPMKPRPEVQDRINRDTRTGADLDRPYGDFGGRFARPASNHPGLILVAFCDAGVRPINEEIDYRVYQQLMTPDGAQCEWTPDPTQTLPAAFLNADPAEKFNESDLD